MRRTHRPLLLVGPLHGGAAMTRAVIAANLVMLLCASAVAKPLDAEACGRLKLQRDALESSGVRSAISEKPPAQPTKNLDERAQRISALIKIDGQLRFRCNMELPIATLRPEALVDVPDTVDGEPTVAAVPRKRPAAKRVQPADALDPATGAAVAGTPAPKRPKTAATTAKGTVVGPDKAATPDAPDAVAVKPRPKPKPKSDDAFRAPATGKADSAAPQ